MMGEINVVDVVGNDTPEELANVLEQFAHSSRFDALYEILDRVCEAVEIETAYVTAPERIGVSFKNRKDKMVPGQKFVAFGIPPGEVDIYEAWECEVVSTYREEVKYNKVKKIDVEAILNV